jgi:hypothetical protein
MWCGGTGLRAASDLSRETAFVGNLGLGLVMSKSRETILEHLWSYPPKGKIRKP